MLRPDDVQALDDSERAKYAKLEQHIDKDLISQRGSVSFRFPSGLWRIVHRIARSYADQGWSVRLRPVGSVYGGYVLSVDHPSICKPEDLFVNEACQDDDEITGHFNKDIDLVQRG
jgi:hypothetical protein